MQLDKYARDARTWFDFARVNEAAAMTLFGTHNPFLFLPAATLGHHTLEMYLKAALICEGMTVFDPRKIKSLDPTLGLKSSECSWGHSLVELASQLASKRQEFDLSAQMTIPGCIALEMPMTVNAGFALFDPFFSELRYPQELKQLEGVGEDEQLLLGELIARLRPFVHRSP